MLGYITKLFWVTGGTGSYSPITENKQQTLPAVEKMRHGTVRKSRWE